MAGVCWLKARIISSENAKRTGPFSLRNVANHAVPVENRQQSLQNAAMSNTNQSASETAAMQARINSLYQTESRRVLATLIRLLRDFDLAEEALQEAFMAAMAQWPREGMPENPRAWLVSTGRFKAIDQIRKRARYDTSLDDIAEQLDAGLGAVEDGIGETIEDDRLRLVFTCCHPSLSAEARTALTLREVCDLTTEEIARAFLVTPPTVAQRIVRAKAKIRDAAIPYEVPAPSQLPERLDSVLQVIYLVFNEGYSASAGEEVTRRDLCAEAIRLARLVLELLDEPEVQGLLALMLLHDARRTTRSNADGELVLLEDQDRSQWHREQIVEGEALVRQALASRRFGPYSVQAAIAAVHAGAATAGETDWQEIVALYDLLLRLQPSPVISLNRAVAVAMAEGPEAGLRLVNALLDEGQLREYHLAYAALADFHRRLGQREEAIHHYREALRLVRQEPERRFLEKRLQQLVEIH